MYVNIWDDDDDDDDDDVDVDDNNDKNEIPSLFLP